LIRLRYKFREVNVYMSTGSRLEELARHKYINLETYKKSGQPVRTPVWFMVDNNLVYVITSDDTGKAKRLRNNPSVRLVPSSFNGDPKEDWIVGKARFVEGSEAERAIQLRKKKYGLQAMLAGMFRQASTVIAIELSP
jgi:uncharacterized protein